MMSFTRRIIFCSLLGYDVERAENHPRMLIFFNVKILLIAFFQDSSSTASKTFRNEEIISKFNTKVRWILTIKVSKCGNLNEIFFQYVNESTESLILIETFLKLYKKGLKLKQLLKHSIERISYFANHK